ncbi:MAG: CarD family transcriptional regulator, partial [Verrucomicrobiota bacterium]
VRLEFFGDELDSLREFDPQAQTSREGILAVTLPPAGEWAVLQPPARAGQAGPLPAGPSPAVLLEHLPAGSLWVLVDPAGLAAQAAAYEKQVPVDHPLFRSWEGLRAQAVARGLVTVELRPPGEAAAEPSEDPGETSPELGFESLEAHRPIGTRLPDPQVADAQRRAFFQQLHRWLRQGHAVEVFCGQEGERERFGELWREFGLAGPGGAGEPAGAFPAPRARLGLLSRDSRHEGLRLVVVSDAEIYGRYKVQRPRRLKSRHAQAARSAFEIDFTDFDEGDFVVHVEHGIALYRGLKTLFLARPRGGAVSGGAAAGSGQECLVLEYAAPAAGEEPARLYVPVSEAHLVSRYVGAGKARPALSTLGSARWAKAKDQAQRAVRDLAADLLAVQAARTSQPGVAFPPDTPWQREFEAAFEFEETPDQLRAIEAAKRDMETAKPMDRLLCGDVGFG